MNTSAIRGTGSALAWRRFVPPWPLLLGLFALARLLAERTALLNDPDTYLHIAAGRWMLEHAALPSHDPFSHSLPGAPWAASEWLAEIVLAASYAAAGWSGVVLLSALSAAAAVALLAHFLLQRLPPLPALIATVAAAALLQPHLLARPHVLALPLLVLWTGTLLAARDDDRSPPFVALPLILLWANLHASFLFGLALAAFVAVEAVLWPGAAESRRRAAQRWGLFVAAAAVMAFVTPWGLTTFVQPVRLTLMPTLQATFAEWLSPDFQKSPALEMWMLGLLLLGFSGGLRLPPARLALLLGLVHMTLQHGRHGDLLAIVAPLAIAAPLALRLAVLEAAQPPSRLALALAELAPPLRPQSAAVAVALAALLILPSILDPIRRSDDAVTPAAAVQAAAHLGLSGPVLNAEAFGGYLVFRGIPTFIDGRIEMYGDDFLRRDYQAESGDQSMLGNLLSQYRIGWTLLAPASGAALVMDHLPGWQRVYGDDRAVIHRAFTTPP